MNSDNNNGQFYITLPSDASMDTYPNNTVAHFRTDLATPINLAGSWEVGLCEITFPHSWHTIRKLSRVEWSVRKRGETTSTVFGVKPGIYRSIEELVAEMNNAMLRRTNDIRERPETLLAGRPYSVNFAFDNITRQMSVTFAHRASGRGSILKLHENLTRLLGFPQRLANTRLRPGTYTGNQIVDLSQGFHALYIYCDLVKERYVGDRLTPLLRHVPVNQQIVKENFTETQTFNPVYFMPVQRNTFQTIEIDIRDDLGETVPFESGKVLVTLVLRQVAP